LIQHKKFRMSNFSTLILKLYFILIFIIISTVSYGQSSIKEGNSLFKQNKYCKAIKYYNKYLKKYVDEDAYLKRGICNYYCNNFKKAIEDLENSSLMGNYDERINKYLAKTYHHQQKFEKAITYYKKHLSNIRKDKIKKANTINQIKRCANAIKLKYEPTNHFIENWGPEINTPYDDINPIQSPGNAHHFYFASNRIYGLKKKKKYNEFQVDFTNGDWEKLFDIFSSNQNKNTIFLDFFDKTNKVAYFLGNSIDKGSIYTSQYSHAIKQLETANKYSAPIKAEFGFRYMHFINDTTVVFSSDKDGGFGGFDLYITGYRNGSWFEPINLGENVNSSFDEISPFITKNGETLFFSSNNLQSIGGFDVFRSDFSYADDDWLTAKNLGLPLSSSADEIGFKVLSSGKGGIYNSNRKDMGFGHHDLYWIYFKNNIDANRSYANEIPYLRNRHLKLINLPTPVEKEVIIAKVDENKVPENNDPTPTPKVKQIEKKKPKTKENKNKVKNKIEKSNQDSKTQKVKAPKSKEKPKVKKSLNKPKSKKKNNPSKNNFKKKSTSKIEKFIIPLLLVKNKTYRDNKTTIDFIDNLSRLMKKYPDIKVEFIGNAFTWEKGNSELLNSVRIAEKLADSLTLRMIEPNRIIVKGVGASLPAAKPHGPSRSKNIIVKANNRIDVFIHNTKNIPIKVKNESFYISRSIEDSRYKLYKTIIRGLSYKIQVKKGDFLFLEKMLEKYQDSSIEKDIISKNYYYTIGLYKEYVSAKELYSKLISNGKNKIEIIPYIDGIRISNKEALKYAKKHVDLVNYLEDNKIK